MKLTLKQGKILKDSSLRALIAWLSRIQEAGDVVQVVKIDEKNKCVVLAAKERAHAKDSPEDGDEPAERGNGSTGPKGASSVTRGQCASLDGVAEGVEGDGSGRSTERAGASKSSSLLDGPSPFPQHRAWTGTLWVLLGNRRWYRWFVGGLWQRFDAGRPRHPYLIWLQVLRPIPDALETEDYRPVGMTRAL